MATLVAGWGMPSAAAASVAVPRTIRVSKHRGCSWPSSWRRSDISFLWWWLNLLF